MPRLPTAQDLGVRSFQDRSTVVTPRVDTSGQDALVSVVSNISQGMNERLDASSLHKAKIHFQKLKLEADTAFDQDPDFETYQERYDEKLKSARESSAAMVRNPDDRATFDLDMSLYQAEGSERMIAKAFSKEVDRGLADLDETLMIGRENYLRSSTQQDKDFAVGIANDAINAAEQATHIDADQAEKMRQGLAVDLAIASVEVAPADRQLELLKSDTGVMQYLPLDTRNKMIENAETELYAKTSLDMANTIREEGGTLAEKIAKVNKITDPKVKASTRAQVINDHNIERTAEGEEKYEVYDDAAKGLIAGDSLNNFIAESPDKWNSLGSKEQSALISMAQTKTPTTTNFGVYHELNMLKVEDKTKAYHYFLDNVSSFSGSDAKAESDYFTGLAEEPKPLYSMKETFNKKASALDIKGDDLGSAEYRIQEEYNTWSKANPGENMDLDTQNTIVNGIFDEVVGTSTWWFGGDKRGYELDRSDADTAKVTKEIERYRIERNNGEPVSVNTMMKIEQVMRQQGLIDG